jgi:hypothetical protein
MKYFEVELNYSHDASMTKTFKRIMDTFRLIEPNLRTLKLSDGFFRFRGDLISSAIEGRIYWAEDINANFSDYVEARPYELFNTPNNEFWVTSSNLADILVGDSIPQRIFSPISEAQGRDYADKLLSLYDSSVVKYGPMMPKGIPQSILILDILIPLASDTPNYLKGIQSKWNEERKNKPEIFILTGERNAKI